MISAAASAAITAGRLSFTAVPPIGQTRFSKRSGWPISRDSQLRKVARDIWMAKLIRDQAPRDVVLIAGNEHVRKDLGVPRWLKLADPQLTVRSIGYLEQGAAAYPGEFDLTQTMSAQARPDPCAKFKK